MRASECGGHFSIVMKSGYCTTSEVFSPCIPSLKTSERHNPNQCVDKRKVPQLWKCQGSAYNSWLIYTLCYKKSRVVFMSWQIKDFGAVTMTFGGGGFCWSGSLVLTITWQFNSEQLVSAMWWRHVQNSVIVENFGYFELVLFEF